MINLQSPGLIYVALNCVHFRPHLIILAMAVPSGSSQKVEGKSERAKGDARVCEIQEAVIVNYSLFGYCPLLTAYCSPSSARHFAERAREHFNILPVQIKVVSEVLAHRKQP